MKAKLKILFISYYWPPAGGVSVQRILHFVKELQSLGVECHVIYPKNPSYYVEDYTLGKLITSEIKLHSVKIFDITKVIKRVPKLKNEGNIKSNEGGLISRISKKIRANWFIPDPKIIWVPKVVKSAIKLHLNENFDLIFTNGTPHSMHIAGNKIKTAINRPWIADFRDPWTKMDTFAHLPLNQKARKKHEDYEMEVISKADICLTVSPSWKEDFKNIGAKNAQCITNGFDEYIEPIKTRNFIISHVGSIHSDRSLDVLLSALKKIKKQHPSIYDEIKLVLVGNINPIITSQLKDEISAPHLLITGQINHSEAKKWIAKSNLLLLPINNSKASKGRIPAKLYEYIAARKPIALFGSSKGDAGKIVRSNGFGKCFSAFDSEELTNFILDIQANPAYHTYNQQKIEKYHRKHLAKELLNLMQDLVNKNK